MTCVYGFNPCRASLPLQTPTIIRTIRFVQPIVSIPAGLLFLFRLDELLEVVEKRKSFNPCRASLPLQTQTFHCQVRFPVCFNPCRASLPLQTFGVLLVGSAIDAFQSLPGFSSSSDNEFFSRKGANNDRFQSLPGFSSSSDLIPITVHVGDTLVSIPAGLLFLFRRAQRVHAGGRDSGVSIPAGLLFLFRRHKLWQGRNQPEPVSIPAGLLFLFRR